MTRNFVLVACVSVASIATVAMAQPPTPPEIEIVSAQRDVAVGVDADGVGSSDQANSTISGPFKWKFSETATGPEGSSSTGSASQDSYISTFSIQGSGEVDVSANVPPMGSAVSSGTSSISISFTLPVDSIFDFTGTLDSSVGAAGFARAEVSLSGLFLEVLPGESFPFIYQKFSQPDTGPGSEGEVDFNINTEVEGVVSVKANTPVFLIVQAQATVAGGGIVGLMSAIASFEFSLDFGDRDLDGLLDVWEEEGIDVDFDGTVEIDLPGYGADPDRKDIFVEFDIMSGADVRGEARLEAFARVKEAFAQAPQDLIYNPVPQSIPIKIHIIDGRDTIPDPGGPLLADPWPVEFDPIKLEYFGTPTDRSHPLWDDFIRSTRLKIFRYCLLARDIVDDEGNFRSGAAEGSPGNDFIIDEQGLFDFYEERGADASMVPKALAGAFMTQLGFALGLREGGTDPIRKKPNYLSTMNHLYMAPIVGNSQQGTPLSLAWRLDYSRGARTIDEHALDESVGVNGDEGRLIIFNSEPYPDPPTKNIGRADGPDMNWNFSGPPDPEKGTYPLDVSRFQISEPTSLDILESPTDWDRLWYQLSGHSNFDDRMSGGLPAASLGPSFDFLEELSSGTWIDQTALTPEVFWNGFEGGDSRAWSDTVP